ncbi:MAG: hypothetical protein LBG44_03545 [Gemmatimonadota bacterium]|nr:hypothetical protein [Gemmatimonadota bacterium]
MPILFFVMSLGFPGCQDDIGDIITRDLSDVVGYKLTSAEIDTITRPSLLYKGYYVMAFPNTYDHFYDDLLYFYDYRALHRIESVGEWFHGKQPEKGDRSTPESAWNHCLEALRIEHWLTSDYVGGVVLDGGIDIKPLYVDPNEKLDSLLSLPTTIEIGNNGDKGMTMRFWALEYLDANRYECVYPLDLPHPLRKIDIIDGGGINLMR